MLSLAKRKNKINLMALSLFEGRPISSDDKTTLNIMTTSQDKFTQAPSEHPEKVSKVKIIELM